MQLATARPVVRRSLKYAVVVGSLLIAINHSDALLAGEVGLGRLARMVLTMMVPYAVSTLASVSTSRDAARARRALIVNPGGPTHD